MSINREYEHLQEKGHVGGPRIEDEPMECRLWRARDPESSPELLRILSEDSFWFVRDYVACNLSTPKDCLLKLLNEKDFRIREDAKRTLLKLGYTFEPRIKPSLDSQIDAAALCSSAENKTKPAEKVR